MTARAMQTDDPATLTGSVEFDAGVVTSDTQRVVLATDQATPTYPIKVMAMQAPVIITPTLSAPGAYAADDYVGVSTTSAAIAGAIRAAGMYSTLDTVVLVDKAKQNAPLELWLFDRSITVPTDNTAWGITDANALFCLGVVDLSGYRSNASNGICTVTHIGLSGITANSGTSIYYALVNRGAPTYANGDLQLRLTFVND